MVNAMAGPSVFDHLYKLHQRQSTAFRVVMPVLRPDYGLTWTDAQARRDAQDRLELMLEFMGRAGMAADGELATEDDPAQALTVAAQGPEGPFDSVVVAWRELKDRWLYKGERERLEEALGIPIESCRADPPLKHSNVEDPAKLRELFEQYAKDQGWSAPE